jgi:hypothetical protein
MNLPDLSVERMSKLLAYDESVRWASIRNSSTDHGFSLIAKQNDDKIKILDSVSKNDARKLINLQSDVQQSSGITTDDVYHNWD